MVGESVWLWLSRLVRPTERITDGPAERSRGKRFRLQKHLVKYLMISERKRGRGLVWRGEMEEPERRKISERRGKERNEKGRNKRGSRESLTKPLLMESSERGEDIAVLAFPSGLTLASTVGAPARWHHVCGRRRKVWSQLLDHP